MEATDRQMTEQQVFVLDIPIGASAEELSDLLNRQYAEGGVYLNSVLNWPGLGARAVFRRLVTPRGSKQGQGHGDAPASVTSTKPLSNAQPARSKEALAMDFLRDHRDTMTCKELRAGMIALGFTRSLAWVNNRRAAVIKAERRVA